jgi:hypothetical protein
MIDSYKFRYLRPQLLLILPFANSVAYERAFSTMNSIHTKFRNRLTTDIASKILYIQFNERTLEITTNNRNWADDEVYGDKIFVDVENEFLREEFDILRQINDFHIRKFNFTINEDSTEISKNSSFEDVFDSNKK